VTDVTSDAGGPFDWAKEWKDLEPEDIQQITDKMKKLSEPMENTAEARKAFDAYVNDYSQGLSDKINKAEQMIKELREKANTTLNDAKVVAVTTAADAVNRIAAAAISVVNLIAGKIEIMKTEILDKLLDIVGDVNDTAGTAIGTAVDSLTAMVIALQEAMGFSAKPSLIDISGTPEEAAAIIADVKERAQAALKSAQEVLDNSLVYVDYMNMTILEMKANVLQISNTALTDASESTQAVIDGLAEQTFELVDHIQQALAGEMDFDKAKADLEKSDALAPGVHRLAVGTIVFLCSWL